MKIRKAGSEVFFNIIAYGVIIFFSLMCLIPFLIIISGSLTENSVILREGYKLFPSKLTFAAYTTLFRFPNDILAAYRVTITTTLVGTVLGLSIIAMTGFVLSQNKFKCRNVISFIIYFTTIFGGGLVPWYMMYSSVLNLKDNLLALILPNLMSPFLIILMRTFIKATVPEALMESAYIEGANDFIVFMKIVLPVIKPALATVGLFLALGYWNDWYLSSLFITSKDKQSLQFYLYNMLNGARTLKSMIGAQSVNAGVELPTESVKLAMTVIATGPVFLFYPFAQKYFIAGITIGSVKG